jgi:hypothetical protein
VRFTISHRDVAVTPREKLPPTWRDLIALSDPDTARRLRHDPANRIDPRRVTVRLEGETESGFTVTVEQLLTVRRFWIPSLDIYLDAGPEPVSLSDHLVTLESHRGERILDGVARDPEATYDEYKARWEDMANPAYRHPAQPAPGHIVGVTWDSAIPKFGIDRGAGIWNDYGNPDRFRLWFGFGDLGELEGSWKGQRLTDGFPVLVTTVEKDGIRFVVEQFAYPLNGPPPERRGNIHMVLLSKVELTELTGRRQTVSVDLYHRRKLAAESKLELQYKERE